jgi:hypothetical protein
MASGSDFEEVKNAQIPLPCPGILLMFIGGGHASIYERFEVTNGVLRSRNSKKDRQYKLHFLWSITSCVIQSAR